MRSWVPLPYEDREFLKTIYYINRSPLEVKDGMEKIDENIELVKERFEKFNENSKSLENIGTSPFSKEGDEDLYDKLFGLYDSKEKLKKSVRKIAKVQCPYCGINESPYHVDHYLPRSKFPEFSIYEKNLIAACSSCNSRYKGDDFIDDETGKRKYFNPYFDDFINNIPILKCKIEIIDDIFPKFKFYIDEDIKDEHEYEYNLIKCHFDNLKLEFRYQGQVVDEVFMRFKNEYIIPETQEFEDVTLIDIRRDIIKRLRGLSDCNINHWEKVFFEELLNCDDCLNLIVEKKIIVN